MSVSFMTIFLMHKVCARQTLDDVFVEFQVSDSVVLGVEPPL